MPRPSNLPSLVREARLRRRWTQTELAVKLGLRGLGSASYISRIERNKVPQIRMPNLLRLAEILDIPLDKI